MPRASAVPAKRACRGHQAHRHQIHHARLPHELPKLGRRNKKHNFRREVLEFCLSHRVGDEAELSYWDRRDDRATPRGAAGVGRLHQAAHEYVRRAAARKKTAKAQAGGLTSKPPSGAAFSLHTADLTRPIFVVRAAPRAAPQPPDQIDREWFSLEEQKNSCTDGSDIALSRAFRMSPTFSRQDVVDVARSMRRAWSAHEVGTGAFHPPRPAPRWCWSAISSSCSSRATI